MASRRERSSALRFIADEDLIVVSFPLPDYGAEALSDAERVLVQLVSEGWSDAEIAAIRGASKRTVANQLVSIFRKLNIASRVELASRVALERGT